MRLGHTTSSCGVGGENMSLYNYRIAERNKVHKNRLETIQLHASGIRTILLG